DLAPLRRLPSDRVDYGRLYESAWGVLARAHDRFAASGRDAVRDLGSLDAFRREHADWLEPFATFMALKAHFGGRPWTTWPEAFRTWEPGIGGGLPDSVRRDADRHSFYQYLFFGQWDSLRRYAAS